MEVMLCHPCAYSSLSGHMNIQLVGIKSKDFRECQLQKTGVFYTAVFVSPQLKHKPPLFCPILSNVKSKPRIPKK